MDNKLVIIGDGEFAEIAYEYFTHDSQYEVAGFLVEKAFRKKDELFGLPVADFEDGPARFGPDSHSAFVAVTFTKLNRVRSRLYREAKALGYQLASYISSRAFVWQDVEVGDNCFIFENNVLQYKVKIGNNVVLWSGNHVGHRSVIHDDTFMSSHVVVSGYCTIGERCFLGVNSTIGDNVHVGEDCVIGAGAVVTRSTKTAEVYKGERTRPSKASSLALFNIEDPA